MTFRCWLHAGTDVRQYTHRAQEVLMKALTCLFVILSLRDQKSGVQVPKLLQLIEREREKSFFVFSLVTGHYVVGAAVQGASALPQLCS